MKVFCRYTGTILQHDTCLNNLGIKGHKLYKPAEHQVFSYDIWDLAKMASFKPVVELTPKQRYLLVVAMIKATGKVSIKFPITEELLPEGKVLKVYPILLQAILRIAVNGKEWAEISPLIPRMEIRQDNYRNLNLVAFIQDVIGAKTEFLSYANPKRAIKKADENSEDWDAVEKERALQQAIAGKPATKEFTFTINMAKFTLKLLSEELQDAIGRGLSKAEMEKAIAYFVKSPENVNAASQSVEKLEFLIEEYVSPSIIPGDFHARTYVELTLERLRRVKKHLNSINFLFGEISEAPIPKGHTVEFEIVGTDPFNSNQSQEVSTNLGEVSVGSAPPISAPISSIPKYQNEKLAAIMARIRERSKSL
jgi:hypothetical protein